MAQFVLQGVYIPLRALLATALTVAAIWCDANSNATVGPPELAFAFAFVRTGLSWRRRRAERAGRGPHYTWEEHARILRRVSVRTWRFRGVGAHGVLTAAAEQGWRLDHSYPADPDRTLHPCRLDDHTRPA
ncbi:hypothetical protein [Streptomyces noursei]|uniref:hypothetical protein n=1 Tax=Streptomyces noursei TaxID=1971 RepID=UPI0023B80BF5|nr:hypothetical protein [Streptomyces noursei]